MVELSEENRRLAEELGYSPEEAQTMLEKAVLPSLVVPDIPVGGKEGAKIVVEFVTNEIKTIVQHEQDKNTRKPIEKKTKVTTVQTEDGIQRTLWLSSESMKRAYLALRHQHPNGVKGVKAIIYKVAVTYEKYGTGIAYRIQKIDGSAKKPSTDAQLDALANQEAKKEDSKAFF